MGDKQQEVQEARSAESASCVTINANQMVKAQRFKTSNCYNVDALEANQEIRRVDSPLAMSECRSGGASSIDSTANHTNICSLRQDLWVQQIDDHGTIGIGKCPKADLAVFSDDSQSSRCLTSGRRTSSSSRLQWESLLYNDDDGMPTRGIEVEEKESMSKQNNREDFFLMDSVLSASPSLATSAAAGCALSNEMSCSPACVSSIDGATKPTVSLRLANERLPQDGVVGRSAENGNASSIDFQLQNDLVLWGGDTDNDDPHDAEE